MSKEPNRNVYVGHRYVPLILEEWNNKISYEGLSVVTHKGNSYTSRKRVPVGIDILNKEFWSMTGNYNAQVDYYRQETERVAEDLLLKSDKTYVDTELGKKSDITYVDTELGKKSDITYVDTELGKKSDKTYVDTELGKKSDKTYVDTELDKKSDITYVDTELDKKSDITYVDDQIDNVNNNIESDKSLLTENINRVSDLSVNIRDFGAISEEDSPGYDSTNAIESATLYVSENGGGKVTIPPGTFNFTKLTIRSNTVIQGAGRYSTWLKCFDSSPGSALNRLDDGSYVHRFGMCDLTFAPATSGVKAVEDIYQDVIGINLTGCAYSHFSNLVISAFGQGAIILSQAGNGSEGMGFTNTLADGNYNVFDHIDIAWCGKYAPNNAVISFKYKANANRLHNIFIRGSHGIGLDFVYGAGNSVYGLTAESLGRVVAFRQRALGNNIYGIYAEAMSSSPFLVEDRLNQSIRPNNIFGFNINTYVDGLVEYTGEDGYIRLFGDKENNLRTGSKSTSNIVNTSDDHFVEMLGLFADEDNPLWFKPKGYNDKYTSVIYENNATAVSDGQVLSDTSFITRDTNNPGINVSLQTRADQTLGKGQYVISTGMGGEMKDVVKFRDNVEIPGGTWDTSHFVMGDSHIWIDSTGAMRIKNGSPTSDTDGTVIGG